MGVQAPCCLLSWWRNLQEKYDPKICIKFKKTTLNKSKMQDYRVVYSIMLKDFWETWEKALISLSLNLEGSQISCRKFNQWFSWKLVFKWDFSSIHLFKTQKCEKWQKLSKSAGNRCVEKVYLSIYGPQDFLHISANPFEVKRRRAFGSTALEKTCFKNPSSQWSRRICNLLFVYFTELFFLHFIQILGSYSSWRFHYQEVKRRRLNPHVLMLPWGRATFFLTRA